MSRSFDAIAIGSGLGGLTAAALFARAGHKVLVLERNANFGGAATVYQHGALSIEASLHEIDGLDASDPKGPILRTLGIDRDIPFVDVGDLHEVRSPLFDRPFVMPHGFDAALAATNAQFPEQARGIAQYFERIDAVRRAVAMMSEHQDDRGWWLWNAPTLPWRLWPLIRDRHATLSEVFGRLFGGNEAVKLALASNLGYYTDDPDTMPFIHFAVPQASYLTGGGHYIRGGSQVLSDRLVAIIRDAGGEVEAFREVESILLDGNRTRGVRHRARNTDDVREELAPVVFGNAAPAVLAMMLPDDIRATFMARYAGRRPSISLWTISLGLKRHSRDFGVRHYSTSILPAWLTTLAGIPRRRRSTGREFAGPDHALWLCRLRPDQFRAERRRTLSCFTGRARSGRELGRPRAGGQARAQGTLDGPHRFRSRSSVSRYRRRHRPSRDVDVEETFDQVSRAVDDTVAHFGRLDILVNNAGLGPENAAEDVRVEDFDLTLAVNLKGTFFASQAAGRVMIRQQRGCIVNMSSQAGFVCHSRRNRSIA